MQPSPAGQARQFHDHRVGGAGRRRSYYWQHNRGSPGKVAHPAAHLHRVEIDKRSVAGVGVDINHILKPRFGSGTKPYRSVSTPSKLDVMIGSLEETISPDVSCRWPSTSLVRRVADFYITI